MAVVSRRPPKLQDPQCLVKVVVPLTPVQIENLMKLITALALQRARLGARILQILAFACVMLGWRGNLQATLPKAALQQGIGNFCRPRGLPKTGSARRAGAAGYSHSARPFAGAWLGKGGSKKASFAHQSLTT